ncbi:Fc.00g052310.m01.CDS01 [Cosmosporella sp. VM-42]
MRFYSLMWLVSLASYAAADPTWPSAIDELEEVMFQLTGFRARKFAGTVSPCDHQSSSPGRQNAAEWLRTGFHDMATADIALGTGGLDASIQYELKNGDNNGPGFNTTMQTLSKFISKKSSLADLIAAGVYAAVRSCGGPAVSVRAGRTDATTMGSTGVPKTISPVSTFLQQFGRMGFDSTEMIQLVACGHTLGGVHRQDIPSLVDPDAIDGLAGFDSTVAAFDNKVVTEYLDGTTKNPLVVGPSIQASKNSDFKVFTVDNNDTMKTLADANTFNNVCKTVLQKMIEVVPAGVSLSEVITPYMVKPVSLQLALTNGGAMKLTGFIRVKTTTLPLASIDSVTVTYKNRDGGSTCGAGTCSGTSKSHGVGRGFDDKFAFFPISLTIPVATGISSFVVTVNLRGGTKTIYDNNGDGYPVQDAILMQMPQSCLKRNNGALTIVAAVRNDRVSIGAEATISYKDHQLNSPILRLQEETITLDKGECIGGYTIFRKNYQIAGPRAGESRIDVVNGDKSDSFKDVGELGGNCGTFKNPLACGDTSAKGAGAKPKSLGTKSKPPPPH